LKLNKKDKLYVFVFDTLMDVAIGPNFIIQATLKILMMMMIVMIMKLNKNIFSKDNMKNDLLL